MNLSVTMLVLQLMLSLLPFQLLQSLYYWLLPQRVLLELLLLLLLVLLYVAASAAALSVAVTSVATASFCFCILLQLVYYSSPLLF